MSEKMELADELNMCAPGTYVLIDVKLRDEIVAALRTSSPAQEPVTTEPVGYGYSAQIQSSQGAYIAVSRAKVAHYDTPLYAIPAPPQPGREWLPIVGMEWPAEPVLLGFWYQGAFKQYIAEHDPAGWMEQGKRTFYPSHMQGWFTHWQPLSAPPAGEPE